MITKHLMKPMQYAEIHALYARNTPTIVHRLELFCIAFQYNPQDLPCLD